MSARTAYVKVMAAALLVALVVAGPAAATSMDLGDGSFLEAAPVLRDIQETIWFQGYLADAGSGSPINATYTVTASIHDAELGGGMVWGVESHVGTVIADGWFNIELGNVIGGLPAFDTPPYYLELVVNGETMSPRLKLASVPSAFQSLGADDGLNLPYSGTYGSSGDAFSITNTGPNIAGYFGINNAGSSAGAVYGKHNGTGAAVMAWHDGVGPAIRSVANGSGYAGVFEGSVAVSDSMVASGLVKGRSMQAEHFVAVGGTLLCSGFWMPTNEAQGGYVLQSQDTWGVAKWAPPNVIDTHVEATHTTFSGGGVVQHDNASVTLDVPGPGYIVVDSQVWYKFDHDVGTADKLYMQHSTSSTSFSEVITKRYFWEEPAGYPSEGDLDRTANVHDVFEIATAGTYDYYLVGMMTSGAGLDDQFVYSTTTAIY